MKNNTPIVTLVTREETLAWLASNDETFSDRYRVKSLWLCHELNRFEAESGFVYNAQAFDRIVSENGLSQSQAERRANSTTTRTEHGLLGSLIYNAQKYRREMKLESEGWRRATPEVLSPFAGKKIEAFANGEFAGPKLAKVKKINDRLLLAPLNSRTKVFADYLDWWVRPIAA